MTNEELVGRVRERQARKKIMTENEKAIDKINLEINTELAVRGVTEVDVDQWKVAQIPTKRETLDRILLVQAGVTVEQLEAGTKTTHSSMLRVDERRGSK